MIVTLTGSNSFGWQRELQSRLSAFVAEYGDMGVERLDGDEATFDRLSEALTSLPFLSNKKMVLLRQPGSNKQFAEKAEQLLANIPETTEVLIVEPKLDKRSSYYKYLKKATDYHEFNELDQNGLARWLMSTAKEQGGTLSQADALYLVSRVGTNQGLLANELEKLLLFNPAVDRDSIEALTESTPQSTIFELLDAAFKGDTKQAMHLYSEQRALKVEPQQIIAMLVWQLHIVALIKAAAGRSPEQVASEAKVSPYTVKKSLSIAQHTTLTQLKQRIADLLLIDTRSKRETFNLDDALQHYLLTLAIS